MDGCRGGRQRGAGSGRGGSWGQEGCRMEKLIFQRLLSREQPEMALTVLALCWGHEEGWVWPSSLYSAKSKIQLPKSSEERISKSYSPQWVCMGIHFPALPPTQFCSGFAFQLTRLPINALCVFLLLCTISSPSLIQRVRFPGGALSTQPCATRSHLLWQPQHSQCTAQPQPGNHHQSST